ncbi:phage major capsid protein, partial [bacterium]|nr:phage major capsid protein [bacterium]
LCATVLTGLDGDIDIPALEAGVSAGWIAENGDATEGAPVWGQRKLSEKTVTSYMPLTRKILNQSSPQVEGIIRNQMMLAIALEIQRAALEGSGVANQPLGLKNLTGINSVSFAALGKPTFKELVEMESVVEADNALVGNMSYLTTTAIKGHLKTEKIDAGSGIMTLTGNQANGYNLRGVNGISSNQVYFGNWADMIIAQFGSVEILSNRVTRNGQLDISIFSDVDIAFKHPQSFVVGNGGI